MDFWESPIVPYTTKASCPEPWFTVTGRATIRRYNLQPQMPNHVQLQKFRFSSIRCKNDINSTLRALCRVSEKGKTSPPLDKMTLPRLKSFLTTSSFWILYLRDEFPSILQETLFEALSRQADSFLQSTRQAQHTSHRTFVHRCELGKGATTFDPMLIPHFILLETISIRTWEHP